MFFWHNSESGTLVMVVLPLNFQSSGFQVNIWFSDFVVDTSQFANLRISLGVSIVFQISTWDIFPLNDWSGSNPVSKFSLFAFPSKSWPRTNDPFEYKGR